MSESNKYLQSPPFTQERDADYKKQAKIQEKWEFYACNIESGFCGNVASDIKFSPKTKRASKSSRKHFDFDTISFYEAISSALLMYRLACTFQGVMRVNSEGYKCVWDFNIRHKETGEIISFGEHKGGSSFWTPYYSFDKVPKELQKDLLELLTYLVSDTCAHPYDGLVAGSVA